MNSQQEFQRVLHLLLLYLISGVLFDFGSTLYAWFIHMPAAYPTLGDLSLFLWVLSTSYIFLYILKTLDYDTLSPVIFFLFFMLIFGEGAQFVANSVQIKLWHIGYNDTLGLGLPSHASLPAISLKLRQIFQFLYFSDEILGHYLIFTAIFLFFLVFYGIGFRRHSFISEKKYGPLFFSIVLLNGLYMAWNMIEGQAVPLFLFMCMLLAGIKVYYRRCPAGPINRTVEGIFLFTLFFISLWIATAGHFKTIPQFFETMKPLVLGL